MAPGAGGARRRGGSGSAPRTRRALPAGCAAGAGTGGGTGASSGGGGGVGGEGGGKPASPEGREAPLGWPAAARAAGTCRAWSIGAAAFLRVSQASSRPFPCKSVSWAPAGRSAHLRLPSQTALIREQANLLVSTCHLLCVIGYSFIVLCWQVAKDC